jgi:predicted regulator of Ras-like GTPase activity (Roadblock/LC7/MglB family)
MRPKAPVKPTTPITPIAPSENPSIPLRSLLSPKSEMAPPPAAFHAKPQTPEPEEEYSEPEVFAAQPAAPAPRASVPQPAPQFVSPASEAVSIFATLSALAEGWPEALRLEIVQLNLADAKIGLPVDLVGEALKRGKVAFPWKMLRSWIRPPIAPTVSAHDNLTLELPLRVVAPIFLSHQKAADKAQQRTEIDESIPNLFFGFPQGGASGGGGGGGGHETAGHEAPAAAVPTHAVAKPIDTNYYVWDDMSDSARVDETEFKRKPTPGTSFITRYATPNEVVSRAAALEGVAGALIALPDGLMVASKISPDLNGDTLAAFLPHIFAKISQCTKELRMGELNNLNFTVGNVPWKIFRVNAIFFAAFGRAGQPLPTGQLVALAAELDRKK